MKRQYLIIGIVGMLIAGGLSGCIEQQQSSKTESLTADDNNSTVELNVGNTVNLTLEQNSASTGYVWNITELNESVLTLDKHLIGGISDIPGTPSNETWLFTANATGTTTLKLVYKQPWVENGDSSNFTVNITVN